MLFADPGGWGKRLLFWKEQAENRFQWWNLRVCVLVLLQAETRLMSVHVVQLCVLRLCCCWPEVQAEASAERRDVAKLVCVQKQEAAGGNLVRKGGVTNKFPIFHEVTRKEAKTVAKHVLSHFWDTFSHTNIKSTVWNSLKQNFKDKLI